MWAFHIEYADLYLHIFQRGFEVLNAILQASVYVTTVTSIMCYNIYHCYNIFFDILLVLELLIYSKKYFLI